jgi:hypothetical protein
MMTARCPSDLALETLLLEPASPAVDPHVGGCARCQARLAEMKRQGEEFHRFVFPATVGAIEEAAARRPAWDLARWLAPLPALAAAAAVMLLVGPGAPPEDWIAAKGGNSMGLAVFLQGGSGPHPARDGEAVPASSSVRFKVRPARPCRLWVVSVDASGQVSRIFPTEGEGGVEVVRTTELPGGAVLDGLAGPERFLALCAPGPVPFARVEGAVRAAVASSPEAVRSVRTIPGLPAGTVQDSVLLEKKP